MSRQLVFIHGRAQENKDAKALKAEWIEAFEDGLAKNGLKLPIAEQDIRFPYYGDTLYEMSKGASDSEAASVIVRGDNANVEDSKLIQGMLEEIRKKSGVTDQELAAIAGQVVIQKGPLNWEWSQTILKAIDRYVPFGSGSSIALFTNDVHKYLKNSGIRQKINTGVAAAFTPGVETVVVSHSLGTVVAYSLLRQEGHLRNWNVPLFVTLGSPLAIQEIRKTLKGLAPTRCPECCTSWFNAMDERDVVALYPLTTGQFPLNPIDPSIENYQKVKNKTSNRHGIGGYLDDKEVAKRIYDALIA